MNFVKNPITKRQVRVGGRVHRELVRTGGITENELADARAKLKRVIPKAPKKSAYRLGTVVRNPPVHSYRSVYRSPYAYSSPYYRDYYRPSIYYQARTQTPVPLRYYRSFYQRPIYVLQSRKSPTPRKSRTRKTRKTRKTKKSKRTGGGEL